MDSITVVGNSKPYDRNPGGIPQFVALCRLQGGATVGLLNEAQSSVSNDAYFFKLNTSYPRPGQYVNLYCTKAAAKGDDIDSYLFDLNARLDFLLDARRSPSEISPGSSKGKKPQPQRIAPQRRRG